MSNMKLFESKQVRTEWDPKAQKWYFAIVDVIAVLTESADPGAYWRKLKERLKKEGNETVTNCHGLKMTAADGKQRLTDVADTEQLLRLIQSIPSPKAEPFKLWLARVGYERLEEIENPEQAERGELLPVMPGAIWRRSQDGAFPRRRISRRSLKRRNASSLRGVPGRKSNRECNWNVNCVGLTLLCCDPSVLFLSTFACGE